MGIIKRGLCYLLVTSSTVVLIGTALQNYDKLRKWFCKRVNGCQQLSHQNDFNILWTNEMSEICCTKDEILSPEENKLIHLKVNCDNFYCFLKNKNQLLSLLNAARFSIDIAMYALTSIDITLALLLARRRGVEIRLITDSLMSDRIGSHIIELLKTDIVIKRNKQPMLMHHKFCLIDCSKQVLKRKHRLFSSWRGIDRKPFQSYLITGSLNWTKKGFTCNWENFFITMHPKFIEAYSEEFSRMWNTFNPV